MPPGTTASASGQGWEPCGSHKPRQKTGDGKVDSTPVHVSGTASSPVAQEDSQQRGTWRRLLPGGIRETPLPLTSLCVGPVASNCLAEPIKQEALQCL